MNAIAKVKASRVKENNKFVRIEDLFFAKTKVFSKEDMEEVMAFVASNMPQLNNGTIWQANEMAHLFGNDVSKAKKLMFVLSCLQDENNKEIYVLTHANDKAYIKFVGSANTVVSSVIEDEIEDEIEEVVEETATEEVVEETATEEVVEETATEEAATEETATEEAATEEAATEEATEEAATEEATEEAATEEEAVVLDEESAMEALKAKYSVKEMKDILKANEIEFSSKDKEAELVAKIMSLGTEVVSTLL